MSLFSNFPQGGKKAGVQSISDGGTGATTAEAALANLGGFPKVDGEALKTRIQPINLGGTGASEANQARQNLGAAAVKEMTKAQYDALPAIDPTIFYALTDVEADGVKIEVGSYVGSGTYNSCELGFSKAPEVLVITSRASAGNFVFFLFPTGATIYCYNKYMYDGPTISSWGANVIWSAPGDAATAANTSGQTYRYFALIK